MYSKEVRIGGNGRALADVIELLCECVHALERIPPLNRVISTIYYNIHSLERGPSLLVAHARTHGHAAEVSHGQR